MTRIGVEASPVDTAQFDAALLDVTTTAQAAGSAGANGVVATLSDLG